VASHDLIVPPAARVDRHRSLRNESKSVPECDADALVLPLSKGFKMSAVEREA
jgi:hypothetical protein